LLASNGQALQPYSPYPTTPGPACSERLRKKGPASGLTPKCFAPPAVCRPCNKHLPACSGQKDCRASNGRLAEAVPPLPPNCSGAGRGAPVRIRKLCRLSLCPPENGQKLLPG